MSGGFFKTTIFTITNCCVEIGVSRIKADYRDVRYIVYDFGDPCADELLRKIDDPEKKDPTALKIAQCIEKNRKARERKR